MRSIILVAALALVVSGCSKVAGDGGNASISGKVWEEYRLVLSNPATTQYTTVAADVEVFIIYGEHTSPDDRIHTNYDGEFQYRDLRPGNYTLYVYSKDTTGSATVNPNRMPIVREVEITDRKQEVTIDDIVIYEES
ncbi:MAG: hypothetical protein KDC12_01690 [Flavobacteriales bacterium]|nr:hypothetical protein [Flavobacteriales bacterium]